MNQQSKRQFRFGLKMLLYLMTLIAVGIVAYLNGYHDGGFDNMMKHQLEKERTQLPVSPGSQSNSNPTTY